MAFSKPFGTARMTPKKRPDVTAEIVPNERHIKWMSEQCDSKGKITWYLRFVVPLPRFSGATKSHKVVEKWFRSAGGIAAATRYGEQIFKQLGAVSYSRAVEGRGPLAVKDLHEG